MDEGRGAKPSTTPIGTEDRVSIYTAELGAIMEAVDWAAVMLDVSTGMRSATVYSDCKLMVRGWHNPQPH